MLIKGRDLPGKTGSVSRPSKRQTRRNPQPLSTSADVDDVPFKSGRAGAVRGNANFGCYTTAGVCSRCPPARPPARQSVSSVATAAASSVVPGVSGP